MAGVFARGQIGRLCSIANVVSRYQLTRAASAVAVPDPIRTPDIKFNKVIQLLSLIVLICQNIYYGMELVVQLHNAHQLVGQCETRRTHF